MATMTIKGLDELTIKVLRETARREGMSINAILLKILKEQLGFKKKSRLIHTDLDHLAGTWSKKDYMEFKRIVDDFEKIDEKMWK